MRKNRLIIIAMILFVSLLCVSAVSAADDLNDTVVSNNEAMDEVASNDVLNSVDVEVLASASHTVNKTNYNDYFDSSSGELKDSPVNEGDIINLDGDFSNVNFIFNKPVNIIGTSTNYLKGCTLTLNDGASGSSIAMLNIFNSAQYEYGIFLNGAKNCVIQGCFVNNTGAAAYAVCFSCIKVASVSLQIIF